MTLGRSIFFRSSSTNRLLSGFKGGENEKIKSAHTEDVVDTDTDVEIVSDVAVVYIVVVPI